MSKQLLIFLASALFSIKIAQAEVAACYYFLERNFFNPRFAKQALAMQRISQSAWNAINN